MHTQPKFEEARNRRIKEMYAVERKTMQEIANLFGISRQRVHQICLRQGAGPGGASILPEMIREALKDRQVMTMTGLARAINRSAGGVREMLVRTGMFPAVRRLFATRRYGKRRARYAKTIAMYAELAKRYGRPLSIEELAREGMNTYRLQKALGKNYIRKLRVENGEPPRKPRARTHETEPVAVTEPTPQEAGV